MADGVECTCPDGQQYVVGDRGNFCGSIACFGGTSGECSPSFASNNGKSGYGVTCATTNVTDHNRELYIKSNEFINLNFVDFEAHEEMDFKFVYKDWGERLHYSAHIETKFFTGESISVSSSEECMAYAYENRYFVVGYYWSSTAGAYVCKFPARTDEFMNKFARLPLPDDKPFKDFGYHDYGQHHLLPQIE